MRNSVQTEFWRDRPSAALSHLFSALVFVVIASWSQHSHASGLWLWGWLGVADIQIIQDTSNITPTKNQSASPLVKPPATSVPKKTSTKGQLVDDTSRNSKDRTSKTAVM